MTPFDTLRALVAARASERQIQDFFKKNLDLLGFSCSFGSTAKEYIAYSEFPLSRGRVDFCVFCDRSRMAVVFFEIKGADFPFLNADGTVNAAINKAAQQMRERVEHANSDWFRIEAHEIRRLTLLGKSPFRHLVGPEGLPHVDPTKLLQVRSVIIGGYTTDDTVESRERHRLERATNRTMFESWDSWLRKNGEIGGKLKNAAAP